MLACGVAFALVLAAATPRATGQDATSWIGRGEPVAEGVVFYRPDTRRLPDVPQPLAVQALALDPRHVDLTTALALGRQQGRARVVDAARREGAVAAVNAGFFVLASGDPTGVLRVDGDLVSDARLMRAAVAIDSRSPRVALTFDRVRVRVSLEVRVGRTWRELPLDGIDAVRRLSGATLYTPRFGPDTATPATGVEWSLELRGGEVRDARDAHAAVVADGRVISRVEGGRAAIPMRGAVLSYGGADPPPPFDRLTSGARIRLRQTWESETPANARVFARADDVAGGAGLLLRDGRAIDDWAIEQTSDSLRTQRHPRTMIGADARGAIWLVTVDGRQPGYSVGLTMLELQQLARAMGLTSALNLDGGGSTTMVVKGEVVNRPSDVTGPRPVSDVLLVRPRPVRPTAATR